MVLLVGLLFFWQLLRKTRCIRTRFVAPPLDLVQRVQLRKTRTGWKASLFGWLVPRGEPMFLANIAEGRHKEGKISRLPAVEIPHATNGTRLYLLAKNTGTVGQATIAGVGDIPIGIFGDSTDRGSFGGNTFTDLTIPLLVQLFGATIETQLVSINSNVALGDLLVCDANGYAKTLPADTAGCFYVFGRALQAGVAGDNIEFDPILPKPGSGFVPIFAGVMAATVAGVDDVLPIAGLLVGDFIVVTLNTQHGAETITTAQAAAGQINVVLSAAASIGNTKYNVAVFRAVNS
jgi:hypothetical protein